MHAFTVRADLPEPAGPVVVTLNLPGQPETVINIPPAAARELALRINLAVSRVIRGWPDTDTQEATP